ncbi:tRNA (adenosine(37)-N6)-threonylcarbamoyltransferase complex transferase subunit TsaD [Fonticella tunisiensis]|uniref:tRNA N6-adenosine threonylcarbamoyltransferase n=1 Tax=Fonticella tunisiensis TaxID=1096341 RepID=A0A4R7K971_9CLOT|nr:tRNA (adenosine(37)-N6)-threonylcarbamoyltransferase complex transferase subunit TsaD [Fonticella tunisiensis]TDT50282.1 O-sialoglycoprotein endopeptidase [Fonticella tunisiensis]
MQDILTLGIETSCDETSAAVVLNGREVLSNVISSQIDIHKKFGGVVPEVASRKHVEAVSNVIQEAVDKAGVGFKDIDVVAATYGPGLVGALLVGLSTAKGLALSLNKPFVGVNHIEGHVSANYIAHKGLKPPFTCLIVSGGHTHLVYVKGYGEYEILGRTRDDAAGEAYDKVARAIGLGYPGGPLIDKLARKGNRYAIDFPRVYLEEDSFDFSFSGLKSAVLNYLNKMKMQGIEVNRADVAASFQQSVVEVLSEKAVRAVKYKNSKTLCLAGGVAANTALREELERKCSMEEIEFLYPPVVLCTDNAAMIACAGYYEYINGRISKLSLNAIPSLKIGEKYLE